VSSGSGGDSKKILFPQPIKWRRMWHKMQSKGFKDISLEMIQIRFQRSAWRCEEAVIDQVRPVPGDAPE